MLDIGNNSLGNATLQSVQIHCLLVTFERFSKWSKFTFKTTYRRTIEYLDGGKKKGWLVL
jgi:hypothetical protein